MVKKESSVSICIFRQPAVTAVTCRGHQAEELMVETAESANGIQVFIGFFSILRNPLPPQERDSACDW